MRFPLCRVIREPEPILFLGPAAAPDQATRMPIDGEREHKSSIRTCNSFGRSASEMSTTGRGVERRRPSDLSRRPGDLRQMQEQTALGRLRHKPQSTVETHVSSVRGSVSALSLLGLFLPRRPWGCFSRDTLCAQKASELPAPFPEHRSLYGY